MVYCCSVHLLGIAGHHILTSCATFPTLARLWCRLTEWKPLRIEVVGHQRIPGVARLDVKGYDGRHLPILPSDHYAVYAQFQLCSAAAQ